MPTLQISYPTLTWHTLEVEVSEDQATDVLEHMDGDRKAEFIEAQVKQQPFHRQYEPYELRAALEVDYATIKRQA